MLLLYELNIIFSAKNRKIILLRKEGVLLC